jgi:chemotaxis protein methyltransferase CheR
MNIGDVAELVSRESGIAVRPEHHRSLDLAVRNTLQRTGAETLTPSLLGRVVDEFTVKETWLFREEQALAAIPWHALAENARARGDSEVRVWSAACSTGEEPYTLAILACEAFGSHAPPVRIVATDISQVALDRAAFARYGARSTRAVPGELLRRYFRADGDHHVVSPVLRKLVELGRRNLTRDEAPGRFDLILCRNVLIYFPPETTARVIAALEGALHEDGMLLLGSADTLCGTTSRLAALPAAPPRPRPRRRPRRAAKPAPAPALPDPAALYGGALSALAREDPAAAVEPLRRALYLDPTFALAAFQLACVYDRLGDAGAARRLFRQTLRTLYPDDERYGPLVGQVDVGDIAAACRARLT